MHIRKATENLKGGHFTETTVLFCPYGGGVGWCAQAQQWGGTQGQCPKKSVAQKVSGPRSQWPKRSAEVVLHVPESAE